MGSLNGATATHYTAENDRCWVCRNCLECPLPACKDDSSEIWGGKELKWATLRAWWQELGKKGAPPIDIEVRLTRVPQTKEEKNEARQRRRREADREREIAAGGIK